MIELRVVFLLALLASASSWAQRPGKPDLTEASLEDLMNIQVTSVSKKEQSLAKAGAAIFVISQDDIRQSGATNIPDLLRLAPGVDVARIDANAWAISIRGFNYRYSTKVLVLIDGRTVYTPSFSGVYWDQQDVPLEDIDRIEVIRGPGGTVWGANAVNGVINIITKPAATTPGGLIAATTGSEDPGAGLVQYGGAAGKSGHYRVFGRYFQVGNSVAADGGEAADSWHGDHGGFRSDWDLSPHDRLTVQGDLFGTSEGQTITTLFVNRLPNLYTLTDRVEVGSGNLLGRWGRTFSNGSETTLQVYYDRFRRLDQALNIVNTGDADFQYHFRAGGRQDVVAGAGFRVTDQSYSDGYEIAFGSGHRRDKLVNSYFQDEVRLTDSASLIVGSKFEHNAYTGFEFEPSAQLVWAPSERQTIWLSASRAIQQPSWFYEESRLDTATVPLAGGAFGLVELLGSPESRAVRLNDFEMGYRREFGKRFSLDAVAFASYYHDLTTEEPGPAFFAATPPPPHLVFPLTANNLARARNLGAEIFTNWQVAKWWRISPGYSFLRMKIIRDASSQDALVEASAGDSPKHQWQLRSSWNLPHRLEFDTSVYYVGPLGYGPTPSYVRLDARLGWRPKDSFEFSVTGQNLLTPHHFEFLDALQVNPTQVGRSIVGKITWHF